MKVKLNFIPVSKVLVIFILVLSTFLRFWNLPELVHFTLDEELEAFVVKNILTAHHFPAIGVAVAPIGIHLSPIFYYLAAIPFWLGGFDPLVWGVTASALGVLTTLIFYLTIGQMFSERIAIMASLLYASSFLMVLYDKHFWNVTLMPLLVIVTIYSLYRVIQKKLWWSVPLSLSLAVGISSHLTSLTLVMLTVVVWWRYKIPIVRRAVFTSLGILIFSQLPLVLFEIRHNFYQSQVLIGFFTGMHSGVSVPRILDNLALLPKVFARLIYTFGPHDFAREHTYGLVEIAARDKRIPEEMLFLSVFLLAFLGYLVFRSKRDYSYRLKLHLWLILITVLSLVVYGVLFKGTLFEFYLSVLFPTLILMAALFLDWLWLKGVVFRVIAGSLLILLVIVNSQAVLTSYHSYGLSKKLSLINWVGPKIGGLEYELHSIGVDHKYEGYRYLFEEYFRPPVRSYIDPQLAWLYQKPSTDRPNRMVVITSTEPSYQGKIEEERVLYLPGKVVEGQFGEINVMVVDTGKIDL